MLATDRRWTIAPLACALAMSLAACGGSDSKKATSSSGRAAPPATAKTTPAPSAQAPRSIDPRRRGRSPAAAGATKVIRGWADTLRGGDVAGASKFFAPGVLVQLDPAQQPVRLQHAGAIRAFNSLLPCGAKLLDATMKGRYVDALFVLGRRPGATCDSPGATARTAFVIRGGQIAEWRRLRDEPGENRGGPQNPQSPAGPAAPSV